jgi:hypothetical protein
MAEVKNIEDFEIEIETDSNEKLSPEVIDKRRSPPVQGEKHDGKSIKKPFLKRVKETFIVGTKEEVEEAVIQDVIVPAIMDAVSEAIYTMVDTLMYGGYSGDYKSRRRGRKRSRSRRDDVDIFDYSSISSDKKSNKRHDSHRSSRGYDLSNVSFDSKEDCDDIFRDLVDELEQYDQVTVYYFCELARKKGVRVNYDWTDDDWGWDDLSDTRYIRTRGGWALDLPDPKPLSK